MIPVIALLHASRGRPKKACETIKLFRERAHGPSQIEYILCVDPDDESVREMELHSASEGFGFFALCENPSRGSAPAWDWAAKYARAPLLIQVSDDVEPPNYYDLILQAKLVDTLGNDWPTKPAFVATSDGYRKDKLVAHAIMTRSYLKQRGEFLHAGYQSVYSDDDVTFRAIKDGAEGRCTFIEAREIVMRHRHHYHDKSVPFDSTYEWQNRAVAYDLGAELFNARNPTALTTDKHLWQ